MGKTKESTGSGSKESGASCGLEKIKSNKAKQQLQRDANKKDQQDTLNLLYPDGLPKELCKARHAEVILNGVKKLVCEKATLEKDIATLLQKMQTQESSGRITLCEKTLKHLENWLGNGGLRQLLQAPGTYPITTNAIAPQVQITEDDKVVHVTIDSRVADALLASLDNYSQNEPYNGDDSLPQSVGDEDVQMDQKTEEGQSEDSGNFEGANEEKTIGQVPNVD